MSVPASRIKYKIFRDRNHFREWLEKNGGKVTELWIGFYKKGVSKKSVSNSDAVEEALCFGWINGKVRKLNDEIYLQRFTPRHDKSVWSAINKKRIQKLKQQGLMTESGLKKVRIAKKNGSWDELEIEIDVQQLPADLEVALKKNKKANENFSHFTDIQKRNYIWWIESAKQSTTRIKRVRELIRRAAKNVKPGMALPKD